MDHIIEVKHLKKSYSSIMAVNDLSFYVERGKLFAFLGPNGAGKSTTINIICTFLQADSGSVLVDGDELGREDDAIRASIGVVFQESLLDEHLTVEENLLLRAGLYGFGKKEQRERMMKAAGETEILSLLKRPYGKLSGGQRRRCDIARALLNTPSILFLDEPTTGLDPQTRRNVWETVKRLQRERGMTVFLTTHYMEEAKEADYVIVIDDGAIAAKGTPASLKERYAKDRLHFSSSNIEPICEVMDAKGIRYRVKEGQITVALENTMEAIPLIEECKSLIHGFTVTNGTLDEAFIEITGKEIRE
ncbi:MAG: multidrug/hemolysin transport system ATP-binding protein [Clostridiales bacterium]|nr:multidrug/hemolysin transport system ATP-binding protein [Clostridiales bacterium]